MRLKATVVVEYDADPEDYQTFDEREAAVIDQANWRRDAGMFFASFEPGEVTVTVEPAPAAVHPRQEGLA